MAAGYSYPDESIIRQVRQQPCLYDPRESDYKDADRKAAVWRQIANSVGMSGKQNVFFFKNYFRFFCCLGWLSERLAAVSQQVLAIEQS